MPYKSGTIKQLVDDAPRGRVDKKTERCCPRGINSINISCTQSSDHPGPGNRNFVCKGRFAVGVPFLMGLLAWRRT